MTRSSVCLIIPVFALIHTKNKATDQELLNATFKTLPHLIYLGIRSEMLPVKYKASEI